MLVSTKGRFALRLMVDLAQHVQEEKCTLKEISRRQGLSLKYLEQIVPLLSRAGMIRSVRGAKGGYYLSRSPEAYSVGEILRSAEGTLATLPCLEENAVPCGHEDDCVTLPFWKGLQEVIDEYIDSVTLQDLLEQFQTQGGEL